MDILKLRKEQCIFTMDSNNEPIGKIKSGEKVIFETCDCFSDTVKTEEDTVSTIDFNRINPATGPLYIEGAEIGDVLKVFVEKIEIADQGAIMTAAGLGVLGAEISEEETIIARVVGDHLEFRGLKIPLRKMIGVIGTAPFGEGISTGTPHDHGGNMDCTQIKEGNILYLPVNTEGGLLSMGDLHAAMGDGEVCGAGIEISGEVTVRVEVVKDFPYPTPLIESGDYWMTLGSRKTMEEASRVAVKNMSKIIMNQRKCDLNEAHMLMSVLGNLRVCQVVDPNMTMGMEFPKKYLKG
ncbi:MAG: acetamidase/formamidase family protein [Tissierellia bacterium]|nr:acetamidase/formamidase family protein [Tissierellia bacterium]